MKAQREMNCVQILCDLEFIWIVGVGDTVWSLGWELGMSVVLLRSGVIEEECCEPIEQHKYVCLLGLWLDLRFNLLLHLRSGERVWFREMNEYHFYEAYRASWPISKYGRSRNLGTTCVIGVRRIPNEGSISKF